MVLTRVFTAIAAAASVLIGFLWTDDGLSGDVALCLINAILFTGLALALRAPVLRRSLARQRTVEAAANYLAILALSLDAALVSFAPLRWAATAVILISPLVALTSQPLRSVALTAAAAGSGCLVVALSLPSPVSLRLLIGGILVATLVVHVGVAVLVRVKLEAARKEANRAAATDPLTGLANRRGLSWDFHLPYEAARARGNLLTVIMADIDHFKVVNDSYGHDAGDRILVGVAQTLGAVKREQDLLVRLGGEEVAWLAVFATADDAVEAAERARVAVADRRVGDLPTVTISLGVATRRITQVVARDVARRGQAALNSLCADLLADADSALYMAKGAGRNQVALSERAVDEPSEASGMKRAPQRRRRITPLVRRAAWARWVSRFMDNWRSSIMLVVSCFGLVATLAMTSLTWSASSPLATDVLMGASSGWALMIAALIWVMAARITVPHLGTWMVVAVTLIVTSMALVFTDQDMRWVTILALSCVPSIAVPFYRRIGLVVCAGLVSVGIGAASLIEVGPLVIRLIAAGFVMGAAATPVLVVAMFRSRLDEEERAVVTLARTDPLTGFHNRRGMYEEVARIVERAKDSGELLTVIMADIDHFKLVNDTYGHDVGDQALSSSAEVLRAVARGGDLLVRLGGEEFAWIAAFGTHADAVAASERARAAIEGIDRPGLPRVTISLGVAVDEVGRSQGENDTEDLSAALDRLIARADEALYRAKRAGRNRVSVADLAAART